MTVNKYFNKKTKCSRTLTVECEDNNVDIDLTIQCNGYEKLNTLNLNVIEAKSLMFALMKLFPKQTK